MAVKVREKVKGSGVWWIFIDHQGKRKSKKMGSDEKFAREVAKKIEARLTLGDLDLAKKEKTLTFGDYAKTWLAVTVPATCKPSTQKSYGELLKQHIGPVFEKMSVADIRRLMVKQFLMNKIRAGFASSTVGHMRSVISGVLNMAVDDNAIIANPAHRLGKILKANNINDAVDPLTRDELSLLLQTFQKHFPLHYPMALTLARTGMRLGEVIALKWGDIDFRGRFITVQRSFSLKSIQAPKSGKARRVDMSKHLTATLSTLRQSREQSGDICEWVFVNAVNGPIDPNLWRRRVFNRALEIAGLRKVRVHDLRHSYASLLIQDGAPLPYIRDQLGHHSIKITVDIYGHLVPGGNKDIVDRLDDPEMDLELTHPDAPYTHPEKNWVSTSRLTH